MTAALALAALLAAAPGPDSATHHAPRPTAVHWIACAGPELVRHDRGVQRSAFGIGTGLEVGSSWLRTSFRFDVHASRRLGAPTTTTGLFALRACFQPRGSVDPYLYAGAGYGTAPEVSDFVLPASVAAGGGLEVALADGRRVFAEVGVLGANERRFVAFRVGALVP